MHKEFEVEYNGTVYEVHAEYKLSDASYTDEFGTVEALEADVVAFDAFVNGAAVHITDAQLQRLIWLEADKLANDVAAQALSDC